MTSVVASVSKGVEDSEETIIKLQNDDDYGFAIDINDKENTHIYIFIEDFLIALQKEGFLIARYAE